jgi:hypothetical protein
MSRLRLTTALAAYAAIALIDAFMLEGVVRTAMWIFIGGLTLKTLIAYKLRD